MNREEGVTILLSSHLLWGGDAKAGVACRGFINNGRLLYHGFALG